MCSWDSTLATTTSSMKPETKSVRLRLRLPLQPEMNSHHLTECKDLLGGSYSLTSRIKAVSLQESMGVKEPEDGPQLSEMMVLWRPVAKSWDLYQSTRPDSRRKDWNG